MSERQEETVCSMCGAALDATARQCRNCGEKIPSEPKSSKQFLALRETGNYLYFGFVAIAVLVAISLPVINWLRQLFSGH
jgi:predicted amidophosphoribosyltransferase